jgi:hypothetical protein
MAVITSLQYARSRVKAAKTHQRIRLTGVSAAAANFEVFNLTHRMGLYARTWVEGANVRFAWSSYGAPPLIHSQDTGVGCTEPRFCWDPHAPMRIILVCTATGGSGIDERFSDDDGLSWSSATQHFATGAHPDIVCAREGMILRAAYVGGAISIRRQAPGESSPGAAFNAKDSALADLSVENDVFRITHGPRNTWWLHCRILAAGATLILRSDDEGATWSTTDGAVTGISSGTHPGIAAGEDGTLLAWAYVAGAAHVTRRRPSGDTAWSTPAAMKDDAGVNLAVRDASFSIARGRERPARWILAMTKSTETVPCDHGSGDDSATFKLL